MKFVDRSLICIFSLVAVGSAIACKTSTGAMSEAKSITSTGFQYDSITVNVKTSDGAPAANIPVVYYFFAKKFYFSNPRLITASDFAPGIYSTLDKNGTLGVTDETGRVTVGNVSLEVDPQGIVNPEKPSALTISVVNGGGDNIPCPNNAQKKYYLAYGSSYLEANKTYAPGPGKGPLYCSRTLLHTPDDPASLEIDCYLDTNAADLSDLTQKAQQRECGAAAPN